MDALASRKGSLGARALFGVGVGWGGVLGKVVGGGSGGGEEGGGGEGCEERDWMVARWVWMG